MSPEIVIPVVLFASVFGIAYIYLMTRNKERMALIEKGASAELFNKEHKPGYWGLKLGVMAAGIGLGIIFGNIVGASGAMKEDAAYPAMIFLFAGLGLVVSHYMTHKK